jgi:hypothetical protein
MIADRSLDFGPADEPFLAARPTHAAIILEFTGLFSNRTLTDRTLFWMASVRCDFQHQPVWSVFACGRKKEACGRKKQHRPNEKIIFFVGSVLSIFYVGIVL